MAQRASIVKSGRRRAKTFLEPREQEAFHTPGRRLSRSVEPLGDANEIRRGTGRNGTGNGKEDLSSRITVLATRHANAVDLPAFAIAVDENDGMTWSAELAQLALQGVKVRSRIRMLGPQKSLRGLPAVASVLGERSVLAAATRLGLTERYPTLKSWFTPALIAASVMLGVILLAVSGLADRRPFELTRAVLILFAIGGLAGTLLKVAQHAVTSGSRRESIEVLLEGIRAAQGSQQFSEFIESLADLMTSRLSAWGRSTFVVVDDYGRLDDVSKKVVKRYLEKSRRHARRQVWFVFESVHGDRFSAMELSISGGNQPAATRTFHQMPLREDQRKRLAELVGKPERWVFTAVKNICGASADGGAEFVSTVLAEFLGRHRGPKARETLSILFLLALEHPDLSPEFREKPVGGPALLRWSELQSLLTRESGEIGAILKAFFGSHLNEARLKEALGLIRRELWKLLAFVDDRVFHVTREAAVVLYDSALDLGLPSRDVGRVFWIFTRKATADSLWVQRLARHSLECEPASVPESLRAQLAVEWTNLLISRRTGLIERCLKGCLLREVSPLVTYAARFIGEYRQDDPRVKARFIETAWATFHLLGDDLSLRAALEAYASESGKAPEPPATESGSYLAGFFESIPIPSAARAAAGPRFIATARRASHVITDVAVMRGVWVTEIIAARAQYWVAGQLFGYPLALVDEAIHEVMLRASSRLSQGGSDPDVLDVAVISAALWNAAASMDPAVDGDIQRELGNTQPQVETLVSRFEKTLLENLETAAILARAFLGERVRSAALDRLTLALLADLGSSTLAALAIGITHLATIVKKDIIEARFGERINRIKEDAFCAINPGRAANGGSITIDEIDHLLDLSHLYWSRLGFDHMADLSALRRLLFNFVGRSLEPEEYESYKDLVEPILTASDVSPFMEVVASLSLSQSLAASSELRRHYLRRAADHLVAQDFGPGLTSIIGVDAALDHAASAAVIEYLIEGGDASPIGRFLDSLDGPSFKSAAFQIVTGVQELNAPELLDATVALLQSKATERSLEDVRDEIATIVALHRDERFVRSSRIVSPAEMLATWDDKADHWAYAALLAAMIGSGYRDDDVISRSLWVLNRDAEGDQYNSWCALALELALHLSARGRTGQIAIPVDYLRHSVKRMSALQSAEFNYAAYSVLAEQAPTNPFYRQEMERWQLIMLERDHLERLPALRDQGRFFIIFRHYCRYMRSWGLPMVGQQGAWLSKDPRQALSKAELWKKTGCRVPAALVDGGSNAGVNAEFVELGGLFFDPPLHGDDDWEFARVAFNAAARGKLPSLFNAIETLPALPRTVRMILEHASSAVFGH